MIFDYHQWFFISHHLGSWALFVLLWVIWSIKEIGGSWGSFWRSLRHEIGHDLTCTLWGERQWLLLTPEWVCSFVNKMAKKATFWASTLCAQFCYTKKARKKNRVRINSSLHAFCAGFMRHLALEALWIEHCRCALFIVFYELHLESVI